MIFVIHLKQTISNSYVKNILLLFLIFIDDDDLYVVEKILRREQKDYETKYRVK